MMHVETNRLLLRPFVLDDSDFILQLLNTAGWIKYIGDRNVRNREQAEQYLLNGPIKSYNANRFGLGMVQTKPHAKPIGMCGLIKRDYLDDLDIGFAFLPEYVQQGYGFEIASGVVDYAFNTLGSPRLLAITLPANAPSIGLLQKLQFEFFKSFISQDTQEELYLFSLESPNGRQIG